MSYQQKYLKYKQKYLNLKRQLAEEMNQSGGGKKVTLDDIEALSATPSDVSAYGYELTGGSLSKDLNNKLSEENVEEIATTTTLEDMTGGNIDSDSGLDISLNSSESVSENNSVSDNLETSEPESSILSGGARSVKSSESSSLSDLDSTSSSSESD